jgi:hypothetical protein
MSCKKILKSVRKREVVKYLVSIADSRATQIVGRGAFHPVVQRRQPFFFPSIMPAVAIVESLARVLECITPPFRQNPWAAV